MVVVVVVVVVMMVESQSEMSAESAAVDETKLGWSAQLATPTPWFRTDNYEWTNKFVVLPKWTANGGMKAPLIQHSIEYTGEEAFLVVWWIKNGVWSDDPVCVCVSVCVKKMK